MIQNNNILLIRNIITKITVDKDSQLLLVMKQSLHYADAVTGSTPCFNGNISAMDWSGVQLRALSLPCHGEEDGSVSNGGGSIPRSQGSGTGNDYPSRYGSIWYFHKDHLGSSTLITDGTGSISQQVEYLPYGEVFLEKQHSSDPSQPFYATPYKFNGKELDEETGLYYYGARYMNPRLSIWYATDPMQEKYPNITSYAYCHNNPISRFDSDGQDDWEINSRGYIVKRIYNENRDAFFVVNNKGKRIKGKSLIFSHGTIESSRGQKTKEGIHYGVYKLHDDKKGSQLFEFLAKNTKVEWSQVKLGHSGKRGLSYITTSHQKDQESGMQDLISKQLRYGYTIREDIHSHPRNIPYPSGMSDEPGDIQYAKYVISLTKQTPKFKIFLPGKNKYINFNSESLPYEYGLGTKPVVNGVVVIGVKRIKK